MSDLNREQERKPWASLWYHLFQFGLQERWNLMRPICCSAWMFIDIMANNKGVYYCCNCQEGDARTELECVQFQKGHLLWQQSISKAFKSRHKLTMKHTSHWQHPFFLFLFSSFGGLLRIAGTVALWLTSPCSMSGRQQGKLCGSLSAIRVFWLNQCGGSSGPYNEHGWNHRGEAGANSFAEQVPLKHKPHYSLHLQHENIYAYLCPITQISAHTNSCV